MGLFVLLAVQSAFVPEWFPPVCDQPANPGYAISEIRDSPRLGRNRGTAVLWIDADESLWGRDLDLATWTQRTITQTGRILDGTSWHRLDDAGLPYRFDPCTQTLWLAPQRGPEQVDFARRPRTAALEPAQPGGFLNLDYVGDKQEGAPAQHRALADLRLASKFSSLRSAWTAEPHRVRRLDSFFDRDDPAGPYRLRLGDDITRTDLQGTAVRYGGLRWGTDFSLQPEVPRFPLPSVSGEAALPSTVELYVNGVRQGQQEIEPGPFTVNNPPVYTGGGDLLVTVRDELGRQTVYAQPFYVSTRTLLSGTSDYAVQAGWQRRNFGVTGDRYDDPFALGTWRHGFTDSLTGGGRLELQSQAATGGLSGALTQPAIGQFDVALSGSKSDGGSGTRALLGFERAAPRFSFAGQVSWTSEQYVELGRLPGMVARALRAQAGAALGGGASVSLAYTQEIRRDSENLELTALTGARPLPGGRWYGYMSWLHSPDAGNSAVVGASRPLRNGQSFSVQFARAVNGTMVVAMSWQLSPSGPLGWNGAASAGHSLGDGDERDYRAGLGYAGARGRAELTAAGHNDVAGLQAGASTSLAWLESDVYWTRPVRDSFVVAEANAPGVRVYRDNQLAGTTGASGRALVPDAQAYVPTRISLDPQDLPLDHATTGAAREVKLAPGGTLLRLAEPAKTFLQVRLRLADGSVVPAGAQILLDGEPADLPAGHEGLVYLESRMNPLVIEARWDGGACRTAPLQSTPPVQEAACPPVP